MYARDSAFKWDGPGRDLLLSVVRRCLPKEERLPVNSFPFWGTLRTKSSSFRNPEFSADHQLLQEVIADYHTAKFAREYLILWLRTLVLSSKLLFTPPFLRLMLLKIIAWWAHANSTICIAVEGKFSDKRLCLCHINPHKIQDPSNAYSFQGVSYFTKRGKNQSWIF